MIACDAAISCVDHTAPNSACHDGAHSSVPSVAAGSGPPLQGFRPEFVVYEAMHNKERWEETQAYLEKHGYRYMRRIQWNHMLEWRGIDLTTTPH